jgi:hypothetical protein
VQASDGQGCLQTLREHLRGYQRELKEELYNVINRDLADYLHLSSKVAPLPSCSYAGPNVLASGLSIYGSYPGWSQMLQSSGNR